MDVGQLGEVPDGSDQQRQRPGTIVTWPVNAAGTKRTRSAAASTAAAVMSTPAPLRMNRK